MVTTPLGGDDLGDAVVGVVGVGAHPVLTVGGFDQAVLGVEDIGALVGIGVDEPGQVAVVVEDAPGDGRLGADVGGAELDQAVAGIEGALDAQRGARVGVQHLGLDEIVEGIVTIGDGLVEVVGDVGQAPLVVIE